MVQGDVHGDIERAVDHPARIEEANPSSVCFLSNMRYAAYLETSKPGVVLVDRTFDTSAYTDITFVAVG